VVSARGLGGKGRNKGGMHAGFNLGEQITTWLFAEFVQTCWVYMIDGH
jgi:hypothetical protein